MTDQPWTAGRAFELGEKQDMRKCIENDEHYPSQRHARAVCLAPSVVFERLHEEARAYARQMGNEGIHNVIDALTDAYVAGSIGADPSKQEPLSFDRVAEEQGWDADSQITVLGAFIDSRELGKELALFAQGRADEENES